MWNAPEIVPSITYADVPRAAEWLEVGDGLFSISTPAARPRSGAEEWQLPPGVTRGVRR